MKGIVFKKFFSASVIEGYFHDPTIAFWIAERKIGEPVMHIHTVTTAAGTGTLTTASAGDSVFSATATTATHYFELKSKN
jgi:hypothetical protein